MKSLAMPVLLLCSVCLLSCDENGNSSRCIGPLKPVFYLTDTSGILKTTFHSGESFRMRFSVTNTTGQTLSYMYTGSPTGFVILQDDSVLVVQQDCAVPLFLARDSLLACASTTAEWLAPQPLCSKMNVTLPPGSYTARLITAIPVPRSDDIPFEILSR